MRRLNRVRTNEDMNVSCCLLDDKLQHTTAACDMSLDESIADDDTIDCRADWLFTGGVAVGGPFVKRDSVLGVCILV